MEARKTERKKKEKKGEMEGSKSRKAGVLDPLQIHGDGNIQQTLGHRVMY